MPRWPGATASWRAASRSPTRRAPARPRRARSPRRKGEVAARKVDPALLAEQRLAESLQALDFATVLTAAVERPQALARGGACRICAGRFGPVLDVSQLVRGSGFV